MDLEKRLCESSIRIKVSKNNGKSQIIAERPIIVPKDIPERSLNEVYFSIILHIAKEEKSVLKSCTLSLAHYLEKEKYLIKDGDYENNCFFMKNYPFLSWDITYYDKFKEAENVDCLVIKIETRHKSDLAVSLLKKFKKTQTKEYSSIFIKIGFIKDLVFE